MREELKFVRIALIFVISFMIGFALVSALEARGSTYSVEPWTVEMNQESYWEDRFGADCTKFENHSGYIPARYDFAVVKAGTDVTIWNPSPDDNFVYAHDGKDISWLMKCKFVETTTTTTVPPSTTTSVVETTTTSVDTSTTTTLPPSSTTTTVTESTTTSTLPPSTSTTLIPSTTTTLPPSTSSTTVVTTTTSTLPTLPETGIVGTMGLILSGSALILVGIGVVRGWRDND